MPTAIKVTPNPSTTSGIKLMRNDSPVIMLAQANDISRAITASAINFFIVPFNT